MDRTKPRIEIPALGTGKREEKISREEAIKVIEQKLQIIERRQDSSWDLSYNHLGIGSNIDGPDIPLIQRYQFNKDRENKGLGPNQQRRYHKSSSMAPYHRNRYSKYRKK